MNSKFTPAGQQIFFQSVLNANQCLLTGASRYENVIADHFKFTVSSVSLAKTEVSVLR